MTRRLSYAALAFAALLTSAASAQIPWGPDMDPNLPVIPPEPWNVTDPRDVFGIYSIDDTATEADGNDVLKISTGAQAVGANGMSLRGHISNGENGWLGLGEEIDPDPDNTQPEDPVFAAIGNLSGRLENGNVLRFSMWMKQDPLDPVMEGSAPQIEPTVKFELFTSAPDGIPCSGPGNPTSCAIDDQQGQRRLHPSFGDKVFDTDLNEMPTPSATYVDMDGDGVVNGGVDPFSPDATLTADAWTLVSTQYEVDDTDFAYDLGGGMLEDITVDLIEEIRPVMFVGDFAGTDLTEGGSLLVDNPMLEIYRTAGEVPVDIPNPMPGADMDILGDYDGSNAVGAGDLGLVLGTWGSDMIPPEWVNQIPAGNVGAAELGVVLAEWGNTAAPPAVPEPAGLGILALAALVGFARRRGR